MNIITRSGWILVGVVVGALGAGSLSAARQVIQQPSRPADLLTLTQPVVLAGPDVGFRVVRMEGQIPVGQIVVRMNGAWIAAETDK